jgi:hypothetical protein
MPFSVTGVCQWYDYFAKMFRKTLSPLRHLISSNCKNRVAGEQMSGVGFSAFNAIANLVPNCGVAKMACMKRYWRALKPVALISIERRTTVVFVQQSFTDDKTSSMKPQ